MNCTSEELLEILRQIDLTEVEEMDCAEFLDHVSGYAERLLTGESVPDGYEQLTHHLKICPECIEEFEALYEALRTAS